MKCVAQVPGDAFKKLLLYLASLSEGAKERTIAQAREVAEAAGAEEQKLDNQLQALESEGEEDEEAGKLQEARALAKLRRARSLKVLQVLLPTETAES